MERITREYVKMIIFNVLIISNNILPMYTSELFFSNMLGKKNLEQNEPIEKIGDDREDKDDEMMTAELWSLAEKSYKIMIEFSALYLSGFVVDSNQVYERLGLELMSNALHACKIIARYVPKLLYNQHIPLKKKLKKCAYITITVTVLIIWVREYLKANQQQLMRNGYNIKSVDSFPIDAGYPSGRDNSWSPIQHRPRPGF